MMNIYIVRFSTLRTLLKFTEFFIFSATMMVTMMVIIRVRRLGYDFLFFFIGERYELVLFRGKKGLCEFLVLF